MNKKNCIYDKLKKILASMIRLSPFSGAPPPSTKQVSSFASSVKDATSPPVLPFHRKNQRPREIKATCSKPAVSCVIVPIDGTGSGNGNLRVLCEERVDMEAWDFIRMVHGRKQSVLNEA